MFWPVVVEKIKTNIFSAVILFFDNRVLYEIMSKNMVKPEGPLMTSKYGAYDCMLDKQGYTLARRQTHPCPLAHTFKYVNAHTHTHTHTYCFYTATVIRVRASMLRYPYIVCFLFLLHSGLVHSFLFSRLPLLVLCL
jgi:hypothetical protein